MRVDWAAYNGANGETWPAVADLDGDGKAEIVIGLGPGGGGKLQVLKDATQNFEHRNWIHLDWPTYNSANGSTHPAIGNLDADARPELVVGFGQGGNGYLHVLDDSATGFAPVRWVQVNWASYNTANGTTWPALGNLDTDAQAELVVGFGAGGGGWLAIYQDPVTVTSFAQWVPIDWAAYDGAVGETHPAVGNLDADPAGEIVVGLAPFNPPANSGGWFLVIDTWVPTPPYGYSYVLPWLRVSHSQLQLDGAGTWPAIGKIR